MKKLFPEFIRRGLTSSGLGPMVLAVLYLILQQQHSLNLLTVNQVCLGIFSLSALAFIAGGINVVYQIEQLPLMTAILIHGAVLYIAYLCVYLLNGWLEWGAAHILVFSGIFLFGYITIWAVIYSINKKNAAKLNGLLKEKQKTDDE